MDIEWSIISYGNVISKWRQRIDLNKETLYVPKHNEFNFENEEVSKHSVHDNEIYMIPVKVRVSPKEFIDSMDKEELVNSMIDEISNEIIEDFKKKVITHNIKSTDIDKGDYSEIEYS